MEYVSGGSLRDLLDQQGQLLVSKTVEIALDLADALTRAHRLDIIHRDLKPANVLLADDGTPRLSDFGIAKVGDVYLDVAPEWAKGIVWYQIFPERFRNGDPNNDPTVADIEGSYPHNHSAGWQVHPWTAEWYVQQAYEQQTGEGFTHQGWFDCYELPEMNQDENGR